MLIRENQSRLQSSNSPAGIRCQGCARDVQSSRNVSIGLKFLQIFVSLFAFLDLLGPAWTCSDFFGYVRTRLDSFGCI